MNNIEDALGVLDKINGMSAVGLIFLSCIVMGYVWKVIPHKWFPNDSIPIIVILWGAFAMSMIADARPGETPVRVWFFRNVIVGAVIGLLAWIVHNFAIKKVEDWLASKSNAVANLLGKPSTKEDPKP